MAGIAKDHGPQLAALVGNATARDLAIGDTGF